MSDPPAARKTDKTDHDDSLLLIGPGAQKTQINGLPAWRAVADGKWCPMTTPTQHVKEIAQYGSYTVFIEGHMANRKDDHCLGSASPAKIVTGSPNVFIGDKKFGLATRTAAFCKDYCEMMEGWDAMTSDEREAALQDVVNKHFRELDIPEIGVEFQTMAGRTNGTFSFSDWRLNLNSKYGGALTQAEKSRLSQTLIHEGRHAEQWWNAAQYSAAQEGATATSIASRMSIPDAIATQAIANPVDSVFGKTVFNSVYGTNRGYRNETFKLNKQTPQPDGAYQRYRTLPEEHDAWAVGDSLSCTCPEKKATP